MTEFLKRRLHETRQESFADPEKIARSVLRLNAQSVQKSLEASPVSPCR